MKSPPRGWHRDFWLEINAADINMANAMLARIHPGGVSPA